MNGPAALDGRAEPTRDIDRIVLMDLTSEGEGQIGTLPIGSSTARAALCYDQRVFLTLLEEVSNAWWWT